MKIYTGHDSDLYRTGNVTGIVEKGMYTDRNLKFVTMLPHIV